MSVRRSVVWKSGPSVANFAAVIVQMLKHLRPLIIFVFLLFRCTCEIICGEV